MAFLRFEFRLNGDDGKRWMNIVFFFLLGIAEGEYKKQPVV